MVAEVGDVVNIKRVTNEPETIAIGILGSKDPLKEVGRDELGSFSSEVIVQVLIKPGGN